MREFKLKDNACESCGILEHGKLCDETISFYREHKLCGYCTMLWVILDETIGRETTFEELINPEERFWFHYFHQ